MCVCGHALRAQCVKSLIRPTDDTTLFAHKLGRTHLEQHLQPRQVCDIIKFGLDEMDRLCKLINKQIP